MVIENKIKTKVIGVDVDVAVTTLAIVDLRGNILAKDSFKTLDYLTANEFVSALTEHIIMLAESNGGYAEIRSVGMSAPSSNFVTGCIENAANLPWKGTIPLAAMLRDRLGLAVALANDGHITALGEYAFGSAHGMKDFLVVSLSHGGIGSCLFSGGQIHLGANGFAGEIGHCCVEDGGRLCGCGRHGCLEEYASAKGMVRTVRELLATSDKPSMLRDATDLSPAALAQACAHGDTIAIEVLRQAGKYLGLGLANYAAIFNPEAIILTGDVRQAGRWMLEPLADAFDEYVFPNIRNRVRLIVSMIDDKERSLLGASALAWEVKEYSLFK